MNCLGAWPMPLVRLEAWLPNGLNAECQFELNDDRTECRPQQYSDPLSEEFLVNLNFNVANSAVRDSVY